MATPVYCRKGGARLPGGSAFCPTCGAAQAEDEQAFTHGSLAEPVHAGTGRQPAGQMLHQRYRLLQAVGQGGMGAVYVAQDAQLGDRLVAVKEMSMSRLTAQELPLAVEQFRREAHLLASLHHSYLPVIHEYFRESDRWYLVMSFIEGQNLQAALSAAPGNRLSVKEVVRIGIELCEVLEYLHAYEPQIIFRDLKPLNIMLTPKGHICLIDFGIARHFKQEQTKDTSYYYSVGYAPPEQYGQSQTGPRSDIYSLGVTLHQMLSGHNPASKPFQFPNLQLVDPTLPVPLVKIITQMLEMSENARPASITAVKEQLEKVFAPLEIAETKKASSEIAETRKAGEEKKKKEKAKHARLAQNVSVEHQEEERVPAQPSQPELESVTFAPVGIQLPETTTKDSRGLAVLSYVLFSVTGTIILCFKKNQSRFQRFHAWQAIFLTFLVGALVAASLLIILGTDLTQSYYTEYDYTSQSYDYYYYFDTVKFLLFALPLLAIGFLYWLLGMIQAARGKMTKLFPVGYIAARLVRKKERYNVDLSPLYFDLRRARWWERVLAFLSYLFLGIPGLLIILLNALLRNGFFKREENTFITRKSRFLRFHTLQAALFFLPLSVLSGASAGFALFLIGPVFVIAWIMSMGLSLSGKYFKLPFVGDFVERCISKSHDLE